MYLVELYNFLEMHKDNGTFNYFRVGLGLMNIPLFSRYFIDDSLCLNIQLAFVSKILDRFF